MARAIDPEPVAPDTPKPIVTDVAVALSPLVRRITAGNPGKMTGPGTNTYLVGIDEIVVIDPGPDDDTHLDAIAGCGGDRIRWIVCTHTHPDHSPGAAGLAARTGAEVLAYDARDGLEIDGALGDGDTIDATEFTLTAVHTPGHASNHLCYLLDQERVLFSGDHVMQGSTVVISPPDGDMAQYLESLERLRARRPRLKAIAPGHGLRIDDPEAKLIEYIEHRLARERQIADVLRDTGPTTPEALVERIYADVDEELHPVARKSVWAHLRKLADDGEVVGDDPDDIDSPVDPHLSVTGLLPEGASRDAGVLLATHGARGFVDGLVSVALGAYLQLEGYSPTRIGVLVTAMMLGSGVLTLTIGTRAGHLPRRLLLQLGGALMIVTGLTFGATAAFGVLLVIGAVGTLNPTSGDVSLFLPLEQSVLTGTAPDHHRTALFARYTFVGLTAAAFGSLAVGIPDLVARHTSIDRSDALQWVFVAYALVGVVVLLLYRRLSPTVDVHGDDPPGPLRASRGIVYRLAAIFSLDSFGGGFVVQSMLALWLLRRFDVSLATTGTLFFWTGLLSGLSAFLAVRIARRIGLIRTMVFTHLPANLALIAAAFAPNVGVAIGLLVFRSLLSTMDVPARSSYVMAVVSPAERAAAASVTNVPRSVAAAIPPLIAGWMLDQSTFGWPLVAAGVLKGSYDLLLLGLFRHHRPPEELDVQPTTLGGQVDTGGR